MRSAEAAIRNVLRIMLPENGMQSRRAAKLILKSLRVNGFQIVHKGELEEMAWMDYHDGADAERAGKMRPQLTVVKS